MSKNTLLNDRTGRDERIFALYDDILAASTSGMSVRQVAEHFSVSKWVVEYVRKCADYTSLSERQKAMYASNSPRILRWSKQRAVSSAPSKEPQATTIVEMSTFPVPLTKTDADYVRIMAAAIGKTRHEFIAAVLQAHKAEHIDIYRALRKMRGLPEEEGEG